MQPGEYKPPAPPNVVTFSTQKVTPPSPIYLQRDDVLLVSCDFNSPTAVNIVQYRLLRPDGVIIVGSATIGPVAGGSLYSRATATVQLAEGWLLGVAVFNNSTANPSGLSFVRVALSRGNAAYPLNVYQGLVADWVGGNRFAGWPGGRQIDPADSRGFIAGGTIANPAAGAEFASSFTSAVGFAWLIRLRYLRAQLVTSATVANRIPSLTLTSFAVGLVGRFSANTLIPASTTADVCFASGADSSTQDTTAVTVALPSETWLYSSGAAGDSFASKTTGIQAGDQWQNIAFEYEVYPRD